MCAMNMPTHQDGDVGDRQTWVPKSCRLVSVPQSGISYSSYICVYYGLTENTIDTSGSSPFIEAFAEWAGFVKLSLQSQH